MDVMRSIGASTNCDVHRRSLRIRAADPARCARLIPCVLQPETYGGKWVPNRHARRRFAPGPSHFGEEFAALVQQDRACGLLGSLAGVRRAAARSASEAPRRATTPVLPSDWERCQV